MDNKKHWLFVFILLTLNAGLFIYLDQSPCQDAICATILAPIFFLGAGILLILNFWGKPSFKYLMLQLVLAGLFIFCAFIISKAMDGMRVLENPDNYTIKYRTPIMRDGIWFALYRDSSYWFGFMASVITAIGAAIGLGMRKVTGKYLNRQP